MPCRSCCRLVPAGCPGWEGLAAESRMKGLQNENLRNREMHGADNMNHIPTIHLVCTVFLLCLFTAGPDFKNSAQVRVLLPLGNQTCPFSVSEDFQIFAPHEDRRPYFDESGNMAGPVDLPHLQARWEGVSQIPTTQFQQTMMAVIYLVAAVAYITYGLRMYSRINSKQTGLGKLDDTPLRRLFFTSFSRLPCRGADRSTHFQRTG